MAVNNWNILNPATLYHRLVSLVRPPDKTQFLPGASLEPEKQLAILFSSHLSKRIIVLLSLKLLYII